MATSINSRKARLALADGRIFHGYAIGAERTATEKVAAGVLAMGEVVFNTSMTGYQEIITDPSYWGQMLTFTYPHIGNVGANPEDVESTRIQASGVILRELSRQQSNYRAEQSFNDYLSNNGVAGIAGLDTRALVLHLRTHGSQMGVISTSSSSDSELVDIARAAPSMEGSNLVDAVTSAKPYEWKQGTWVHGEGYRELSDAELNTRPLCVAVDYGIKYNILRLLIDHGFRVQVVPGNTSSADILKYSPDAVFLSNGPGDPAAVHYAIECTKELVGKKPLFGICLGHQILGLALGAPTFKLKFGHRGANHPVRDLITGKVEITVQNHGFATRSESVPKTITVSHLNLNDNTIEGFRVDDARAFSIQYHPESSPGPHDARYLFKRFRELVG